MDSTGINRLEYNWVEFELSNKPLVKSFDNESSSQGISIEDLQLKYEDCTIKIAYITDSDSNFIKIYEVIDKEGFVISHINAETGE